MYFSGQNVIKRLAPHLAYILFYYGKQITLDGAVEVAGRIDSAIQSLGDQAYEVSQTDLYEQEIRQYFSE